MSEDGRPDGALRTSRQIRTAHLDRLREDERLWTAYERGWCDFLQMYLDSKLMQGETDYITLQPADHDNGDATAGGDGGRVAVAAIAQDPQPPSGDLRGSSSRSTEDADDLSSSGSDPPPIEDKELRPTATTDRRRHLRDQRGRTDCAETGDPDASSCRTDAHAEEYASDDSSRDAESEVRRVMFGDTYPDSSEAEAIVRPSSVHYRSADDSAAGPSE